jgi:uncharacterized protein (TIGR02145 family)
MRTKLSKFALAATLGIAITFTFSCSSPDDGEGGGGGNGNGGGCPDAVTGDNTVTCGGKTYRTVQIGGQRWMAENLNYDAKGSKCYDNGPANCDKYGRLYDWATALALPDSCNRVRCASQIGAKRRGICPSSWHIPSSDEYSTLIDYVGKLCNFGTWLCAGTKLKATSGWNPSSYSVIPVSTDEFGFSALPGGLCYSDDDFLAVGNKGAWWIASEENPIWASDASSYSMSYEREETDYSYSSDKSVLISVRCLQD